MFPPPSLHTVTAVHILNVSLPLPRAMVLEGLDNPNVDQQYADYYHNLAVEIRSYTGFLVSHRCFLFRNRTFYVPRTTGIQGIPRGSRPPALFKGVYPHAITLCHDFMHNFYHVFIDIVSLLLLFPPDIIAKSVIVMLTIPKYVLELFNDTITVCVLQSGSYIFAENAYYVDPIDIVIPLAITRLRVFSLRRFGLTERLPDKYCLINRGKTRVLANIESVLAAFKKELPDYPWSIEVFRTSLRDSAVLFSSMRVFFAPHGAGTSNIVFMQKGTLWIDIESNRLGTYYLNMSLALGIHCVFTWLPAMVHESRVKTKVPEEMIQALVVAAGTQLKQMDSESSQRIDL
jgi:hypothetical protein